MPPRYTAKLRRAGAERTRALPLPRQPTAASPWLRLGTALTSGGMRTNWGTRAHKDVPELLPDYEPSVGATVKALHALWGNENSDPAKVAQVILRLAASDRLPAHLLIGSDAVRYAREAEAARAADADQWREMSVSTDVDAPGALPALPFDRLHGTLRG